MRSFGRIFSLCIHISLWSGFQGVHGEENALFFMHGCGAYDYFAPWEKEMIKTAKKTFQLFCITIALSPVCAIENAPMSFCGVQLGSKIPDGRKPSSKTESYYVYRFNATEKILKFNQFQFHASLISKTLIDAGAGYTTESRKDAENLFTDTCNWLVRKYPGNKLEDVILPNRMIKVMIFGENADSYYMIEMNEPIQGVYVVLITLYNGELIKLQEREAKEFALNNMIGEPVALDFNVQQLNTVNSKYKNIHENIGECSDGWATIVVPSFVTFDIPPTLELQKGAYKILKEVSVRHVGIDLCNEVLTVQQSGLSKLDDGATRRYARIIFRSIFNNDADFNFAVADFTPTLLKQIEDEEYTNAKATIMQLQRSGFGPIKLIKWYPIKKVQLGGLNGYRIAYLRQQKDRPVVYVEEYKMISGRYIHSITFSYRQEEAPFWENDYAEIKRRIKFSKSR